MSKFTFKCDDGNRVNEVSFEAETWIATLEEFQCFLKGCGFEFDGEVTILDEDELFETIEFDFDCEECNTCKN